MTSDSNPRVAYLGPPASFSHATVLEALPNTRPIPLPSFGAILAALQNEPNSYSFGVLPVENSTNGAVVQALDLLARCGLGLDTKHETFEDLEVVGEWYLPVHHYLFVTKQDYEKANGSSERAQPESTQTRLDELLKKLDIKTLYSHPQVWGQCNIFLGKHFPPAAVERVDISSTSAAAGFVSKHGESIGNDGETGTMAAISSSLAGEQHGLACLAESIEDNPGGNTTRFLILRNRNSDIPLPELGEEAASAMNNGNHHDTESTTIYFKSLFVFTIPHRTPGTLATALNVFSKHKFNLTAIQSRPSKTSNWHYVFFVECQHSVQSANISEDTAIEVENKSSKGIERIERMTADLKQCTEKVKWLGTWKDMLMKS